MDLNAIIENMETSDQDAALMALQTYNKKVHCCRYQVQYKKCFLLSWIPMQFDSNKIEHLFDDNVTSWHFDDQLQQKHANILFNLVDVLNSYNKCYYRERHINAHALT